METTMWDSGISRKRLLQNITLLWTLRRIPEKPTENILSSDNDTTYRLTAKRENEIVGNLAFLSATIDDHLKVMAVCVEEDDTGEAVTIRIASNTGDLSEVVNGFKRLGVILEQTAQRGNSKDEDKQNLLREIVKLDLFRILSRLRSSHARRTWKTIGKAALIPQLSTALNDSSVRPSSSILKSALKELRDRARQLLVLFTKLENLPALDMETRDVQDLVMDIVTEAHELTTTTILSKTLHTSSNLDPTLVNFLPEALGKLGRYYSAASELACAARDKRCRVFLTVRIEPCQIEVPRRVLVLNAPVSIQKAADSLFQSSDLSKTKSVLKTQIASSLSRSNDKFREAMGEISQNGKVHAEIQLLFFYELHPRSRPPRVICSSKSACYLCNLFIHLHGHFVVPRTHGRLYEKWILPDWLEEISAERRQNLRRIITQMNSIIEDKIRAVYTGTQKPFLHPNESVLVERAHWPSTSELPEKSTLSAESTITLRQEITAEQGQGSSGDQSPSPITREDSPEYLSREFTQQAFGNETRIEAFPDRSTPVPAPEPPAKDPPTEIDSKALEIPRPDILPAAPPAPLSQLYSAAPYQHLIRGEPFWKRFSKTDNPLRISTTSIHATVVPGSNEDEKEDTPAKSQWVQLKWLHHDEPLHPNVEGAAVVHLSDLEVGVEIALKDVDVLYLCQSGDVVEINCSPKEPV